MSSLGVDYLLLLWVLSSTVCLGVAICARLTRLRGVALLGYGVSIGVAAQGLFGFLIGLNWSTRHVFAVLLFVCVAVGAVDLVRGRIWRRLAEGVTPSLRTALLLWLAFLILCVTIVHLDVRWPAKLPPGMFIFEKHRLNTKVQYMTGLPTDNYIPYIVTEFLLRGISFKEQHPILPGKR